ncbi:diacylglycerol kinase [Aestuariispira insulae]|uniref:Diacylglycerol kinase n=1 Tax=Aestuariispira insulae TaxID=1461337 RepID=A0A3D9HX31_9PROT|nr:diacylglycerol kinase [Aestuariispira insulae]RED53975.1 diacylglycerol kinase [Aestuariispira insulae]
MKGSTSIFSVKRIWNAVGYSIEGFKSAFRTETAFRQEVVLSLALVPVILFLDVTAKSKLMLAGSLFLVLFAELINSAIEAVVDRVSFERHELSKKAKDIGSAIVFLALVYAAIIWAVILWPLFSDGFV